MEKTIYDLLIVGGGPAGYTAALYAARAGLSTLVLEKLSAGGQMTLTETIDNYPGFPDGIDGFTLGEAMQQGAERFGAETELADSEDAELLGKIKRLKTSEGDFYGRTVILASGAVPRRLGIPGEERFMGKGVHSCAACDGMQYKGKKVAVIGGGNSAVHEALLLSRICGEVLLIHRRETLRADAVDQKAVEKSGNIRFVPNSVPLSFIGEEQFSGIRLQNRISGEETVENVDGVFVSIGREPETKNFIKEGGLKLDEGGYISADETGKTNLPGVFAAGDVRTKALRQIVTAVSDGANAAFSAVEYLKRN